MPDKHEHTEGASFRGNKNHAELLARARRALDGPPESIDGGLEVYAEGEVAGLAAKVFLSVHAGGALLERTESRLGTVQGFDGERGWSVDSSGLPGACELGDLERLRLMAAVWSGRWLLPDSEIEIESVGERSGHAVLAIRVRGGSGRFRLTLDGATALPRSLEPLGGPPFILRYGRFEPGGWCRTPRLLELEQGHLRDRLAVLRVEHRAEPGPIVAPATEDHPPDEPTHPLEPVASRLSPRGRLPLVYPLVDGREVGPFLLDTGASQLGIDARLADRLGFPSFGRTWVVSSDGGTGACYRAASRIQLGAVGLDHPVFVELDLEAIGKGLGVVLAGVVGYDLFARGVVEITPTPFRVRVGSAGCDPELPKGAPWTLLRFEERRPQLPCSTEGGEGLLAMDTGSSSTATLYLEAIRSWSLGASPRMGARIRGVGGSLSVAQRRLKWLSVGTETFADVRVVTNTATEGIGGVPGRYGAIGWGLFKNFDLLIDYPRRRLSLRRSSP